MYTEVNKFEKCDRSQFEGTTHGGDSGSAGKGIPTMGAATEPSIGTGKEAKKKGLA